MKRCRRNTLYCAIGFGAWSLASAPASARATAGPDMPRAAASQAAAAASQPERVMEPPASRQASESFASAPGAAPSAAEAERAKQLYELGAEAFAAQRNAEAIRYFRRAAAVVPSSKLIYNIALAYEEMGDTGRALAEYRSYLRQEQGIERRDDVLTRVRELESRLAATGVQQLSVLSSPAGATVRLGEETVGVTPWSGELLPGLHEVELELAGHEPRSAEVVVPAARAAELRLELTPRPLPRADKPAPGAWTRVTPLTWSFLGVGAGAVAGGVAFELSRAASSDDARRSASPLEAAEARGAEGAKQMASLLLLGFGGGFFIAGGVLLAVELTGQSLPPAAARSGGLEAGVAIPCAPSFCGFTAQGRF